MIVAKVASTNKENEIKIYQPITTKNGLMNNVSYIYVSLFTCFMSLPVAQSCQFCHLSLCQVDLKKLMLIILLLTFLTLSDYENI